MSRFMADEVERLTVENAKLVEDVQSDAAEKCKAAVRALNDGEADRNRMDWLEKKMGFRWFHDGYSTYSIELENIGNPQKTTVRQAIDAAMED